MNNQTKNYIRGIIFQLIPIENREEVTEQIYEQTKDLKNKYDIELITKGVLLQYQQIKEQEGRISRVAKDISQFIIDKNLSNQF